MTVTYLGNEYYDVYLSTGMKVTMSVTDLDEIQALELPDLDQTEAKYDLETDVIDEIESAKGNVDEIEYLIFEDVDFDEADGEKIKAQIEKLNAALNCIAKRVET